MMYFMHAKTFQNVFIENESRKNVLKAQYVLVSTKIRKRDREVTNIISTVSYLYPDSDVMNRITKEDQKEEYFNQLNRNRPLLATLVLGSIEKKYNIIFMCTPNEAKQPFMKWLADYIYYEFGYPVYDYKAYANKKCAIRKYDKDKVRKKCKKLLTKTKQEQFEKNMKTERGRQFISDSYKGMSKKEMRKDLKSRNLYRKGMDKKEMIEMLQLFM